MINDSRHIFTTQDSKEFHLISNGSTNGRPYRWMSKKDDDIKYPRFNYIGNLNPQMYPEFIFDDSPIIGDLSELIPEIIELRWYVQGFLPVFKEGRIPIGINIKKRDVLSLIPDLIALRNAESSRYKAILETPISRVHYSKIDLLNDTFANQTFPQKLYSFFQRKLTRFSKITI